MTISTKCIRKMAPAKLPFLVAAFLFLLMSGQALAAAYSPSYSINGVDIYLGVGETNANNLEAYYLSSAPSHTTETFEGFSYGATGTLSLAMGSLTGNGYVSDVSGVQSSETGEYNVTDPGQYYYSNGNIGNQQGKNVYTLSLDTASTTLGFYIIDPNDVGGTLTITISSSVTGNSADFVLEGSYSNGTLMYFLLDSEWAFDTLTFSTTSNDGYGIDDISVTATPIPGAAWLLGTGLLGLLGLRRKFMV